MQNSRLAPPNAPTVVTRPKLRVAGIFGVIIIMIVVFSSFTRAKTVYQITDGASVSTVETHSHETEDVLVAAGIVVSPTDQVHVDTETGEITIIRSQRITILCDGAVTQVISYGETVEALLLRLDIALGEHDLISKPVDSQLEDDATIEIIRKTVITEIKTEAIAFESVRKSNASMYKGQEKTTTAGVAGERSLTYEVITIAGEEASRTLVSSEVVSEPVTEVVEYGTRSQSSLSVASAPASIAGSSSGGTIYTSSGTALQYSKVITCTATAYTTENKSRTITATGTTARVGAIAVDPRVIPYGTKMYIVSADGSIVYGVATAEDCGNFRGNHVDLFFNTYNECINFGRRTLQVYILK